MFFFLELLPSMKLTYIAPDNGWLEDYLPFGGPAYFQGRAVSFREGDGRNLATLDILQVDL